jgi:hypothetical protein
MWSVVNEAGTATGIRMAGFDIAGKTERRRLSASARTSASIKIIPGLSLTRRL